MGFWSNLFSGPPPAFESVTPNENGPLDYNPGDPSGVEFEQGEPVEARSLPFPLPTPWSGWPGEWSTPAWSTQAGLNRLVDTAWDCLDLNSNVLSAMPVYRTQGGRVLSPKGWMTNSDPLIYTSWAEFAKQLFWDYMLGEAFILPMAKASDGYPLQFRVVPPWLVNVELRGGRRIYAFGSQDVTDEILHIRYQSNTADARGHGPLEAAGARMTQAGLLQRYVNNLVETGGIPQYWLEVPGRRLTKDEADDLLQQWIESRTRNAGRPAILSGGALLHDVKGMSAADMTLLELSQFTEARIAVALGVPPVLVGLPSGGDSMTYSNVESLFDFHDRASLGPKAVHVMQALSGWLLPRGQSVELNRDDYSRQPLKERAEAYKILVEMGALTPQEVRDRERFNGEGSAVSLTGGDDA